MNEQLSEDEWDDIQQAVNDKDIVTIGGYCFGSQHGWRVTTGKSRHQWLMEFAGQIMQSRVASCPAGDSNVLADQSTRLAEALLRELERTLQASGCI